LLTRGFAEGTLFGRPFSVKPIDITDDDTTNATNINGGDGDGGVNNVKLDADGDEVLPGLKQRAGAVDVRRMPLSALAAWFTPRVYAHSVVPVRYCGRVIFLFCYVFNVVVCCLLFSVCLCVFLVYMDVRRMPSQPGSHFDGVRTLSRAGASCTFLRFSFCC
jgi:hypothetical protein